MNAENRPSAMRLKAGAMRAPPEIGALTAAKALRAAVAQAAEQVAALEAAAGAVEELRQTRDRFVEGLPEAALLALVEGPDSRFGLVVLDPQVVAALIEIQTTGRVVPRPAEPRPPTRTDAIICADFIDRTLELLEAQIGEAELEVAPVLSGFRYAMALADPRAVAMTLEDLPYRLFRFSVDLGRGAKSGAMQLLLPYEPPGRGVRGVGEAASFTAALEARVLGSSAELAATLARREMALSEVLALAPGALIPLPRDALGRVAVEDLSGRVVAHGKLGQVGGARAVRLMSESAAEAGGSETEPAGLPPALPGPGLAGNGFNGSALPGLADLPDAPGGLAGGLPGGATGGPAGLDPAAELSGLGGGDPGLADLGDLGRFGSGADGPDGLADLPDPAALARLGGG